ncbi:MAG: hypothetical protein KBT03_03800 [Bacteroidales bacterium]|nr:hypothetical protein [Candidatus Scybalousia scybalohippi]
MIQRLKINGIVLPDTYVARGSYHFTKNDRIIDQYTDADFTDHVIVSKNRKVVISFNFREHDIDEHNNFVRFLEKRESVEVEYYDDYTMEEKTGVFKMSAVDFQHYRKSKYNIQYAPASVTLTEY